MDLQLYLIIGAYDYEFWVQKGPFLFYIAYSYSRGSLYLNLSKEIQKMGKKCATDNLLVILDSMECQGYEQLEEIILFIF